MRILLAEDEKALSNALVTILKRNNYSVDAVYNGSDALDYAESGVYDCIILDIMMPKLDGLSVLKAIREQKNTVPVMLLTAKSEVDDKVAGLDRGADDYLTKPFSTKELLARLRAITRRQTAATDNSIKFGDVTLDRETYELCGKSGKITLTSKEYQVMEGFMANPGKIISQEKIMEKVWGFDSETEINVVWTYISYLRNKLKNLGSSVKIKAIRNAGYRIEYENA